MLNIDVFVIKQIPTVFGKRTDHFRLCAVRVQEVAWIIGFLLLAGHTTSLGALFIFVPRSLHGLWVHFSLHVIHHMNFKGWNRGWGGGGLLGLVSNAVPPW